ncbi:MAG: hypothetical protein U0521_28495 [Anaerolineae bacterium]
MQQLDGGDRPVEAGSPRGSRPLRFASSGLRPDVRLERRALSVSIWSTSCAAGAGSQAIAWVATGAASRRRFDCHDRGRRDFAGHAHEPEEPERRRLAV